MNGNKACTLKMQKDGKLIEHDCYAVRWLVDKWLDEFRKENATDQIFIDRSFLMYKRKFEQFLEKCKCLDEPCKKCAEEDKEGVFCRCEARNMALAKKLRDEKKSPWTKSDKKNSEMANDELAECMKDRLKEKGEHWFIELVYGTNIDK